MDPPNAPVPHPLASASALPLLPPSLLHAYASGTRSPLMVVFQLCLHPSLLSPFEASLFSHSRHILLTFSDFAACYVFTFLIGLAYNYATPSYHTRALES